MTVLRWRYLFPAVLVAVCVFALCVVTAVSLFYQQAAVTRVLRENVSSRRAAADLRGVLNTIIALEVNDVETVAEHHARAQVYLDDIRRLANQPFEVRLSEELDAGFKEYLRIWQSVPPRRDPTHMAAVIAATQYLEKFVLLPCRQIEGFNDGRVEETTAQHERVLSQLAWGMAVVCVLGAVAGVVFGFGLARALSRSIQRLKVQIRSAAGKLGPDVPEIVLTGEGGFGGLHGEVERLSERIERVVQDLHDREQEVARAEQLAAVGQLAAGVGHEIRNPLTAIKLFVQAALDDPGGGLTLDDLKLIEQEVRRIEQSLRTFLDFARPPKAERRPSDLIDVLRTVVGLVRGRADKQRVAVSFSPPHGPVVLNADPAQLRQVFVNLALNALDAMPTGGELRFAMRVLPDRVEVEVADTGPGVTAGMVPRLFTPFASSKDTGLGLGLVISKRIVGDHGGEIGAENRADGASFFVRLPMGAI